MFTATAFICLYNEADIIADVLRHLLVQGVGVHIIDNWSTDGSGEIARGFPLVGYERFPAEGPSKYYSWRPLLQRVEVLAVASGADWCIHHDADEIRRSYLPGERLCDGLARVDREGYTAVNFQVFHFLPTDDLYRGDPERHFRHYTLAHEDCNMRQVKAWKNTGARIDLAGVGGHFASFPGVRVYPHKFVLKHYPMRTVAQAKRKVLQERLARYDPHETGVLRWHVQYRGFETRTSWLWDPRELREWTIMAEPDCGARGPANLQPGTHQSI